MGYTTLLLAANLATSASAAQGDRASIAGVVQDSTGAVLPGVTVDNFGSPASATRFDPATPRPSNWEETFSVVQQLFTRVAVTAGYYRRDFQNLSLTKNAAIDLAFYLNAEEGEPQSTQNPQRRFFLKRF